MTTTRTARYAVVPASPVLGAEIIGVNLANGVDVLQSRWPDSF